MRKITVSQPKLIGREIEYVTDAVSRAELSFGRYTQRFEREFADYCETEYCLTCVNGTAALHLVLLALGVRPGDYVIVPALTYVATVAAVRYVGAIPAFVDVDPDTWTISVDDTANKLAELRADNFRCVAMIPVHLYGVPCEMEELQALAEEYSVHIIEDAAQAHGAVFHGQKIGSFGIAATFSFYGNKVLTSGEGGAVVTSDARLAEKVALYRGQGVSKDRTYWHTVVGYNYRLSNVLAAIACAQLENAEAFAITRKAIWQQYWNLLPRNVQCQKMRLGTIPAYWMFTALVPDGVNRDEVRRRLDAVGVETRPVFPPIPAMPPYAPYGAVPPVAEDIAKRGINLPTHCGLTVRDVEFVAEEFRKALQ